jgi:isoleucyl-tRNA synthetase
MVHNYPHCWRTDKPVLYYPLDSWFIRTTAVKDRMMELNETVNWKPESTGTGRFGKWLENLQDWNLSRSRFWGTPLPIWRTEDGKEELCVGSLEELYRNMEKAVSAGITHSNPLKDAVLCLVISVKKTMTGLTSTAFCGPLGACLGKRKTHVPRE